MTSAQLEAVFIDIPLDSIYYNADWNCRGAFNPSEVVGLAEDIKVNKLAQPIIVVPRNTNGWSKPLPEGYDYRLVAGHRRYGAMKYLKRKYGDEFGTILSRVMDMTELQARSLNLRENIERKDLNMVQEANGIKPFLDAGWSLKQIAVEVDQSVGWVSIRKTILNLDPRIQDVIKAGLLTQEQIKTLAEIPSLSGRFEAIRIIKEAKAKGETAVIQKVRKKIPKPTTMRVRKPSDMFEMQDHLMDSVGPGLWSRVLAWCSGAISDIELYRSIKEEVENQGKRYTPPNENIRILLED